MYWKLFLDQTTGRLSLMDGNHERATCEWFEQRKTGEDALAAMQKLLKQEGLVFSDVERVELDTELFEGSTARRVAETIVRVYALGGSTSK